MHDKKWYPLVASLPEIANAKPEQRDKIFATLPHDTLNDVVFVHFARHLIKHGAAALAQFSQRVPPELLTAAQAIQGAKATEHARNLVKLYMEASGTKDPLGVVASSIAYDEVLRTQAGAICAGAAAGFSRDFETEGTPEDMEAGCRAYCERITKAIADCEDAHYG